MGGLQLRTVEEWRRAKCWSALDSQEGAVESAIVGQVAEEPIFPTCQPADTSSLTCTESEDAWVVASESNCSASRPQCLLSCSYAFSCGQVRCSSEALKTRSSVSCSALSVNRSPPRHMY